MKPLLLLAALLLAACQSTTPTTREAPGVPLGDSSVHVSGTLQSGGTVSNH